MLSKDINWVISTFLPPSDALSLACVSKQMRNDLDFAVVHRAVKEDLTDYSQKIETTASTVLPVKLLFRPSVPLDVTHSFHVSFTLATESNGKQGNIHRYSFVRGDSPYSFDIVTKEEKGTTLEFNFSFRDEFDSSLVLIDFRIEALICGRQLANALNIFGGSCSGSDIDWKQAEMIKGKHGG